MDNFGVELAERLAARSEGIQEFRDAVVENLEYKVKEFDNVVGPKFRFPLVFTKTDHEVEVSNTYKSIKLVFDVPPGIIQVRVGQPDTAPTHFFEASIRNADDGFICDQLPSECADPEALAEWMLTELFEQ